LEGVHTVLSVLKILDPQQMQESHLNLLRAAVATGTVRRFSPSDYSLGPITHATVDLLAHKSMLLKACQGLAEQQGNNVEIAQFENGMFMEYLAQSFQNSECVTPSGVTRREELLSGLEDDLLRSYIDVAHGVLLIPTTDAGEPARFTITRIVDIGKFVAAALDLPAGSWDESDGILGMSGCTVTFEEIRRILREETNAPEIKEEVVTREDCLREVARFDEELSKGFSVEALKGKMVAQMEAATCNGRVGETVIEPMLNRLCSEVEVTDLRAYLSEVWGRKK
jgi:hypothetical protein